MAGQALRDATKRGARSELQFRNLLETLPAAAYTCDVQGLITYFNAHAAELWGRTPRINDHRDRFCGSFKLHAKDGGLIEHDRCWMALALRDRRPYNGAEMIIERPDGQRVTALAHANPIMDDSGKLVGAVNVLVDISQRKQAEEILRDAHDKLAQNVIERTRELTELSHHLLEIAEAERAKLAAELHDEMGSLLTVLSMRLNRLGDQLAQLAPELVEEQRQLIELVKTMVASQRRIVQSLRPVLLDTFGLGIALGRHVEDWSRNTGISMHASIPSELPRLPADAALAIFRVTQESLTNVAKYASATSVDVSVTLSAGKITVCVEDDGTGISALASERPSAHGILEMRERLLSFGGQLTVSGGRDGRGTRVCAIMPLPTAEEPAASMPDDP